MKVSELIKHLRTVPQDFEVEVSFKETRNPSDFEVRTIRNIIDWDIGFSDRVVVLSGDVND